MNFSLKKIAIWVGIAVFALLLVWGLLLFFNRSNSSGRISLPFFGSASQNTPSNTGSSGSSTTPLNVSGSGTSSAASANAKVFLITQGPVVNATLIDESVGPGTPRITMARYITADDGHVLDLPLDVPGAYPKVVSQTTIPGVDRALFTNGGGGVIMQYLEGTLIKTVHLAFLSTTQSTSTPTAPQTAVNFLPDAIEDLAVSPDGSQVAYLLNGGGGLDGYIAKSDGTKPKKVFSLALSEITLSWPASGNLIAYSKPASGVPGIVFSINAKTGAVSPILYGSGLTAAADAPFTHLLYEVNGTAATTYNATLKTGAAVALSGIAANVNPEQCIATSSQKSSILFCGAPAASQGGSFIDLWHQGLASASDALIALDLSANSYTTLAVPATDGGENSNIIEISMASHGNYLSFVNKDNGKLWGVRLSQ